MNDFNDDYNDYDDDDSLSETISYSISQFQTFYNDSEERKIEKHQETSFRKSFKHSLEIKAS